MDPDSLNQDPDTNPDPAFLGESGYGYESRVLMTKTKEKNTDLIKNNNFILSNLQGKPSALKREQPAFIESKSGSTALINSMLPGIHWSPGQVGAAADHPGLALARPACPTSP